MEKTIDSIDAKIIGLLQKNGRMPNTEIAKLTGISETTVRYRLQRLINEGYIQIVAVGNPFKLGFGMAGTIQLKIDIKKTEQVERTLRSLEDLWYVARTMGSSDFETEYYVKSIEQLRQLIDTINAINGVLHTETSMVLEYIKERYDWGTHQNGTDAQ
jgi:Lrp/AsnC family transcriptional regulator, regulator for asnA, asnC and gidA